MHSQNIVAAASIRGRRLFRSAPQIVRRLFEGGVYSRAASIRGNTVYGIQAPYQEQLRVKLDDSYWGNFCWMLLGLEPLVIATFL